jgi:hypothetical protein
MTPESILACPDYVAAWIRVIASSIALSGRAQSGLDTGTGRAIRSSY